MLQVENLFYFIFLRNSEPLNTGMGTDEQIQMILVSQTPKFCWASSLAEEPSHSLPVKPVMAYPDLVALQGLLILLKIN